MEQLQLLREKNSATATMGEAFQLSEREVEVLRCIKQGLTTSTISEKLYISQNTVSTYRHRLTTKLGAHNVAQLIERGRRFLDDE
mgnify:CR=1 FL=1